MDREKKVQRPVRERVLMVEEDHKELSVAEQCRILGLHRSAYYYERSDRRHDEDLDDLKLILVVLSNKAFFLRLSESRAGAPGSASASHGEAGTAYHASVWFAGGLPETESESAGKES